LLRGSHARFEIVNSTYSSVPACVRFWDATANSARNWDGALFFAHRDARLAS
jgi:hypothetical protein